MAGRHKYTAVKKLNPIRTLYLDARISGRKMNSKPKILIIDDDEALCESIVDIVELDGYLTDCSYTAANGLEKIKSSFCNIVMLDMKLPDSDGLTVLEKIKQESPDTEVIIFTAYAQMDTVIAAMDEDAFSFLLKPFEMPYLLKTIKRALTKQQLIHENRILYQQTIKEEREWEETFDSISDLVSIHDKDLNIIRCNKAVREKLNVDYSDIIGKKCHEMFHYRNEPWPTCPFLRCKKSLKPEAEEEECMGGTFMMSCFPRLDTAGRFNGVVHIARDITEKIQSEKVLMESENKFRTLVDNIPGVAYRCKNDENWTMGFISSEIQSISGYPPSDFENNSKRSFNSIIHPDDRSLVKNTVVEGIKNTSSFEIEYRIIDRDKRTRWVFERGTGVLDHNGKLIWIDGAIFDISGRKQAEEAMNTLVITSAQSEGQIFFKQTVNSLYDWLNADCVAIGHLVDKDNVKTLIMKKDGELIENLTNKLTDYPCECFSEKGVFFCPEGIADMFQNNVTLIEKKSEGYLGIPLRDSRMKLIGVLCALTSHEFDLPLGADKVFEIIAARASIELEHMQSEKKILSLARILEESLNEIYIFDSVTLKFLQVNKGARLNLGYLMEELTELTPLDLKTKLTLESFQNLLEPLRSGKKETITFETTHRRKDGSFYDIEVHIQNSTFESSPVFVAMALDISQRKMDQMKITRQNIVLNAISKVFKISLTCKTERELAEKCLSIAETLTDSEFGLYGEINKDGLFDTIAMSDPGWDACVVPTTNAVKLIKNMEIRGIDRSTMKEGRSRIVNKPDSHPDKVGAPEGHPPITSFMGIPLKLSGKTIGMIGLANKASGYSIDDQLAIEALSDTFVEVLMNKRAEKALFESERKSRAIFDNTYQFIGLLNPDGTLIEANQGSLDFIGADTSDVINRPFWETPWWSHSETLQRLLQKSIKQASQGNFVRFEATHIKKDGTHAFVDTSLTPVKDKDGNVIYIIPEGRDITELKLAEETLHKLSQAIQQSNVIVIITDLEGNIEYVNPRFCDSTGYTHDEIIGQNPRILKSGETSDEEYRELWKTITSGNEWRGEFHNKKKNGVLYWENASISPIRDIDGKIINFLGIKEDITDKKRAEQALVESEQKSRIVSDTANDGIIMIDNNGIVSYWNSAAEKMFGYSSKEAIGKEIANLIIPDKYKQLHTEGFKKFKDTGQGPVIGKTMQYTAVGKNIEEFPIEHSISAVKIKGKWHAVGIFRDIAERLKTEEQLRISYKMASLGRLTAGVFHELLNPVNIISSHVQLLLMDAEKGSSTEEDLLSIQDEIKRIVKISDSLLRFSRKGETGGENLEMNDLLDRTISIVEPEMKLERVIFERKFDDNLSNITANKDQLRQVFLNLFTNARDAMPDGGTITVSTENITEGEFPYIRIKISDTGCGIDRSKIHKVFDPFFTTKSEGKGTGLGLSTSYGIIEDHGGVMSAESEVGKGTAFIIDMPIKI